MIRFAAPFTILMCLFVSCARPSTQIQETRGESPATQVDTNEGELLTIERFENIDAGETLAPEELVFNETTKEIPKPDNPTQPTIKWLKSLGSNRQFSWPGINGIASDAEGNAYMSGGLRGKISLGSVSTQTAFYDAAVPGKPCTSREDCGSGGYICNLDEKKCDVCSELKNIFVAKVSPKGEFQWIVDIANSDFQCGKSNFVRPMSIAADPEGNSYILAEFGGEIKVGSLSIKGFSSKSPWEPRYGLPGLLVTKIDTDGKVLWVKAFETRDVPYYYRGAVALDAKKNIYIMGLTRYGGAFPQPTGGLFVTKLNNNGQVIWAKSPTYPQGKGGHLYELIPEKMQVDLSGDVVLSGNYKDLAYSGIMFGKHPLKSAGLRGTFMAKLNSKGSFSWLLTVDGATTLDLALDSSGNAIVAGWAVSWSRELKWQGVSIVPHGWDKSLGNLVCQQDKDCKTLYYQCDQAPNGAKYCRHIARNFLAKVDAQGATLWAKSFPMCGDTGPQIKVDQKGSIYLAGAFSEQTSAKGVVYATGYDPAVHLRGCQTDLEECSQSYYCYKKKCRLKDDLFLAKYTPNGKQQWLFTSDSSIGAEVPYLMELKESSFFLFGHFKPQISLDGKVLSSKGNATELFLVHGKLH